MMGATNNMLVCRRFMKYKHLWIHFTTNQLMCAIIILAVCSNTIVQCNASADISSDQIDCTSYNTCNQCTNETACEWLFEKQSCDVSDQRFTSNFTQKSCPRFKVIKENYKNKNVKIKVISEEAEQFKTLLDENKIKCQVGAEFKNVMVENDNTISCDYSVPKAFIWSCHQYILRNPLFIEYFSIIIGDIVRLKFDEVRDHYLALYPCSPSPDGTSCSVNSICTTAAWDDGPNQYYCNWCLENQKCANHQQEGKCYARDTAKGTSISVGNVVHVKGDDVRIESFSPSEGPVSGDMALRVKIRGHKVLGSVHDTTTVTVAGRECRDPKTQEDGETIACMVVANETAVVDGPVVVTYRSAGQPAIEISSAGESFTFTCTQEPSVDAEQSFEGIASGGTQASVRGSFKCARDPHLFVWFNGTRYSGDICSTATGDTAAAALLCRSPKLPEAATTAAHNVGVQWTFRGHTVYANVTDGHYTPRRDPVFTDFQMDDQTVTINGVNVDDVRREDVTVRLWPGSGDGDADDECVVQSINRTSVVCAVASNTRSAANTNALVIWVGRNLNQTVEQKRSDAVVQGDRPERLLSGAVVPVSIFFGSIVMLLAVSLLVRSAISRARRQRKKWYMQQLRDITAGIDEESL